MTISEESCSLLSTANTDPETLEQNSGSNTVRQKNLKGILAACLSVFMLTLGVTSIQLLERRVPDLELQVFRCVAIISFCLKWMVFKFQSFKVPLSDIPATLIYSAAISFGSTTVYIAYSLVPASAAECLMSTGSILSGFVIFSISKQEKFSPVKVLFLLLCVAGLIFVIQPWHGYVHTSGDANKSNMPPGTSKSCKIFTEKLQKLNAKHIKKNHSNLCGNEMGEHLPTEKIHRLNRLYDPDKNISPLNNKSVLCSILSTCLLELTDVRNHHRQTTRTNNGTIVLLFRISCNWRDILGFIISGIGGLAEVLIILSLKTYPCLSKQRFPSLFWAYSIVLVFSTVLTFSIEEPVWIDNLYDVIAVSVHCCTSVAFWVLYIVTLQYTSGTVLIIILSTCSVWFLIPQYTFLASILPGHRNWIEVVGVFMVLFGSLLSSLYEMFNPSEINI